MWWKIILQALLINDNISSIILNALNIKQYRYFMNYLLWFNDIFINSFNLEINGKGIASLFKKYSPNRYIDIIKIFNFTLFKFIASLDFLYFKYCEI